MSVESALGANALGVILTLVLLEAVLSFDNAAILAALSRRVPREQQARVLNYGLGIAYVLRLAAIGLAVVLTRNPLIAAIGGGYLVFLFLKHFWEVIRHKEHHGLREKAGPPLLQRLGLSAFTATIIQIGFVDLAFAVDQVVAAVGFTRNIWLIVAAATIGLLSLRIMAPYLARLMGWLPILEHMAFVAVGFVGAILVSEYLVLQGVYDLHVPTSIKVGVTLSLFGVPVLWKLTLGRHRGASSAD